MFTGEFITTMSNRPEIMNYIINNYFNLNKLNNMLSDNVGGYQNGNMISAQSSKYIIASNYEVIVNLLKNKESSVSEVEIFMNKIIKLCPDSKHIINYLNVIYDKKVITKIKYDEICLNIFITNLSKINGNSNYNQQNQATDDLLFNKLTITS